MTIFLQTKRFLWQIDPGYCHLKLAVKTILAIMISLWWTADQPRIPQLMAATASGFAMQGVVAKEFGWRIVQVLLLSVSYFLAFILGLWVRESVICTSMAFIGMAFLVNYARRFNLRYSIAPMMVWVLCFIATILPFHSREVAFHHIDGLVKGLVVSAVVLLLIWPENYRRLFRQSSLFYFRLIRDEYRACARWLATGLKQDRALPVKVMRAELLHLLESNRIMEQSQSINRENPLMSNAIAQQHALYQAFFLLTEALLNLQRKHDGLCAQLIPSLVDLFYQTARVFDGLGVNKKLSLVGDVDKRISMNRLNEKLAHIEITEPQIVMNIMNIKTAIQLINQHIQRWVVLNEAT